MSTLTLIPILTLTLTLTLALALALALTLTLTLTRYDEKRAPSYCDRVLWDDRSAHGKPTNQPTN